MTQDIFTDLLKNASERTDAEQDEAAITAYRKRVEVLDFLLPVLLSFAIF